MTIIKSISAFSISLLFLSSCKKTDSPIIKPVSNEVIGAYVLSEGGFGSNNTKLSFYNYKTNTVTGDFFLPPINMSSSSFFSQIDVSL